MYLICLSKLYLICLKTYRMMVELAESLGRSSTYGLLCPYLFNANEGTHESRERDIRERLDEGDKTLYILPYWKP